MNTKNETLAVAYGRISTDNQQIARQVENLKKFAFQENFEIVKFFTDSISGKTLTTGRGGFNKMLKYLIRENIKIIFVSEISRIGRRVSDVVNAIETLVEQYGITLYVQHPVKMVFASDKNGGIDIIQKSMLTMLGLGAEMELHYQQSRRFEGIEIAKRNGKYKGRIKGSKYSIEQLLSRHRDIVGLLKHSTLPDTQIAKTVGKGLSTVKRVKKIITLK